MKKFLQISAVSLLLPLISYAQLTNTELLILRVGNLVSRLIILVAAIALLAFFWGLVRLILKSGGEKGVEDSKNIIKWGLISLFVMMSVWGIIRFFQGELGIAGGGALAPVIFTPPGR